MNALYIECNSGISGDMSVASLIDLGADVEVLNKVLKTVPLTGFKTEISRVKKNGIDACDFNVILDQDNHDHDMNYLFGHEHHHDHDEHSHEHHHDNHHHEHHHSHRGLAEVTQIINSTQMTDSARSLAIKIFDILADAESKAHGIEKDKVHFHEVGAVDSIVDIISIAVCFDNLGITKVYVPKIFEGSGTVRCRHGILPIPVPAVMNIAQAHDLTLSISEEKGEFITPTGAAFIAAVKTDDKLPAQFKIKKTGLGAGKREYARPSLLRSMIIEADLEEHDQIIKIETNIDDITGENLGFVMDLLFANGARDVSFIPCFMKKNRPAYILNVICTQDKLKTLEKIIFENTTTIGLRKIQMDRTVLLRQIKEIDTPYGKVRIKCVEFESVKRFYPEYEDIAAIAKKFNKSYTEIFNQVIVTAGNLS
ncbi:MAG: nickel pincer cofactor biosynthesis protein LarC [Treponema sp.]|nr:nickel pincer cofactor biosynthesis protein LarC [Treponema sp.]